MVSTSHALGDTSQLPNADAFIRKSNIETLITALNANSGNISSKCLNSLQIAKPVIVDS